MQLLEQDELYLRSMGYEWEVSDGTNGGCLVIKGYPLCAGKYDQATIDLLICIPQGYNDAKLDMFYADPSIRLKSSGEYPPAANVFEQHAGRTWQRFSRHLTQWRAGRDSLQNFMPLIDHELQGQ